MLRNFSLVLATLSLAAAPSVAMAESEGITFRGTVPVHCVVRHSAGGYGANAGNGVVLGQLREFCNAANGYQLVVSYTPGSLEGAVLTIGDDSIVLNGSGHAVISQERGPRIRERTLAATPGARGFDADHLNFQIQAI